MITSPSRALAVAVACVMLAACASGGARTASLSPADLAALEAQRAQHPTDPDLNLRLAKAYVAASRFADARASLGSVLLPQPENRVARAYLGFAYEGLQQFDSARAVYGALLAGNPGGVVSRLLNGRLALLARKELHASARAALAQEAELGRTPPDPSTVAVFPFRYTGQDSTLRPLERGLAALVVSDLSHVRSLRLVERERLQALLDEMQLTSSGRVDPATGARSGHLVGAGQVVQGQFQDGPNAGVRLDAAMVRATDAQVAATGSGRNQLNMLFDLEKSVVFQLLAKMGVPLSPAESIAISERPTRDLQAFLLYSRGLEAQDRGDFGAASVSFRAAARRDPSFQAAAQQAQSSEAAQTAGGTGDADIATIVGGGTAATQPSSLASNALTIAINSAVPSGASIVDVTPTTGSITPPSRPDPVCEVAACQGPGGNPGLIGTIIIIIRRP
jgi:tetratricopeptide (TPR) repeat protein